MKKYSSSEYAFRMLSLAIMVSLMTAVLFSCGRNNSTENLTPAVDTDTGSLTRKVDCSTVTATGYVSAEIAQDGSDVFVPDSVTIKKDQIVKWTNNGNNHWYVVSDDLTVPEDRSFDSLPFAPGSTVCYQFRAAGTYNYHCNMDVKGVVIVTE